MKQWQNLTDMFKENDIRDEMVKKYKNTVLGIVLDDDKTVYMNFVGYDNENLFCFVNELGLKSKLALDTLFQIFIPNPEKGLYNSKDGILFFERKPLRQWKRGLNKDNANIICLERQVMYNEIIGKGWTNQFEKYWQYVTQKDNNEPISLNRALDLCKTDANSWAINRTYGVMAHPSKPEGFILMHHNHHVGEIVDNEILVENKIFKQEILDTQTSWCPNYKVI
jgi:hypothetical protein